MLLAEGHSSPGPHRLTPAQAALPGDEPLSPPAARPRPAPLSPGSHRLVSVLLPGFWMETVDGTASGRAGRDHVRLRLSCGAVPQSPRGKPGLGAARREGSRPCGPLQRAGDSALGTAGRAACRCQRRTTSRSQISRAISPAAVPELRCQPAGRDSLS